MEFNSGFKGLIFCTFWRMWWWQFLRAAKQCVP